MPRQLPDESASSPLPDSNSCCRARLYTRKLVLFSTDPLSPRSPSLHFYLSCGNIRAQINTSSPPSSSQCKAPSCQTTHLASGRASTRRSPNHASPLASTVGPDLLPRDIPSPGEVAARSQETAGVLQPARSLAVPLDPAAAAGEFLFSPRSSGA